MAAEKNSVEKVIDIIYNETGYSMEMEVHYHNSHEIIFVIEGMVKFRINNNEYTVGENSAIFISNFETHEIKVLKSPYRRYIILIKPEYFYSAVDEPILASILKQRPEHFKHVIKINEDEKEIFDRIKDMYSEVKTEADFMQSALGSKLNLLFISLYRSHKDCFPLANPNRSIKTVIEIQKYIDNNILENITLKKLASKFFIDMYYLSHQFKKVTGFTFKEYLIMQRISRAKDQLYETDNDITQVALNSGFNNVNHFIRIFKKYEGVTPYQYRKKLRDK